MGVTEMLTMVIGQGLAGLNVVRSMLDAAPQRTPVSRTVALAFTSGCRSSRRVPQIGSKLLWRGVLPR
jgi:hypothetical protein